MDERGWCVLGECGEVVQAAYDAFYALEDAHGEDDHMLDDGLFPFWEITEVRASTSAAYCLQLCSRKVVVRHHYTTVT